MLLALNTPASALVLDSVVAYIGDEAITLSELQEAMGRRLEYEPTASRREVLDALIDRRLLVQEARKFNLQAPDDEALVREYLEMKFSSYVLVKDADVEQYYHSRREAFAGRTLDSVREDIRRLLMEQAIERKLKEHSQGLKKKYHVKIVD